MSYTRVIPRDLFNEAKLLKCLGQLSLKVLDKMMPGGITIEIEEEGNPFNIDLDDNSILFVTNMRITVNGVEFMFGTQYNSKENYPFYLIDNEYCQHLVFDDQGNWSEEFINFCDQNLL